MSYKDVTRLFCGGGVGVGGAVADFVDQVVCFKVTNSKSVSDQFRIFILITDQFRNLVLVSDRFTLSCCTLSRQFQF